MGKTLMRRAARTDANHSAIGKALRAIGASVADTSRVGGGFPDLVVGYRGKTLLLEVKDGRKPPSARMLTDEQKRFATDWRGQWACVISEEAAIELVTREA
jgi:hypothetical protein